MKGLSLSLQSYPADFSRFSCLFYSAIMWCFLILPNQSFRTSIEISQSVSFGLGLNLSLWRKSRHSGFIVQHRQKSYFLLALNFAVCLFFQCIRKALRHFDPLAMLLRNRWPSIGLISNLPKLVCICLVYQFFSFFYYRRVPELLDLRKY